MVAGSLFFCTFVVGVLFLQSMKKFQHFEYNQHKIKVGMTVLTIVCTCANMIMVSYFNTQYFSCVNSSIIYKQ